MADEPKVNEQVAEQVTITEPPFTVDGFEVRNPEPGKEYRWLRDNPVNVRQKRLLQGWKPVDGASTVEAGVREADGSRRAGDTILAERPIEVGDALRRRRVERQRRLEEQPREAFLNATEDANREARDAGFAGRGITAFDVGEGNEEKVAMKSHRKNYRMGAGIDPKTGEVVR